MTLNPADYHAYTDGVDTIVGTSIEEALEGFKPEMLGLNKTGQETWTELPSTEQLTIADDAAAPIDEDDPDGEVGDPIITTKSVGEWIEHHLKNNLDESGTGLSRRHLCAVDL